MILAHTSSSAHIPLKDGPEDSGQDARNDEGKSAVVQSLRALAGKE